MSGKNRVVEISEELSKHFTRIGVESISEYQDWCRRHGFGKSLTKSSKQLGYEERLVRDREVAKSLQKNRKKHKNPRQAILAYLDDHTVPIPKEAECLSSIFSTCTDSSRKTLCDILRCLISKTDCLFNTFGNNYNIAWAIPKIAYYKAFWVRPLETWEPKSHNVVKQYSSLLRHLFAKYDVPIFMDKCWQRGIIDPTDNGPKWFIHIGSGKNIRTAGSLPLPTTKKMAHYFVQAPDDFSLKEAFRYGQILALGGSPRLVQAIRSTFLGNTFAHCEFWESVFRWFIDNPMLDLIHFGPIVDYINNQKFVWTHPADGPLGGVPPVQPNFSMKKREPASLLRAVEAWHRELGNAKKIAAGRWNSTGINPLNLEEGEKYADNWKHWTTTELLTSNELIAEGRTMNHCVGSYSQSCSSGRVSIWSLRCETLLGVQHIATIEVSNQAKAIVQVRGKRNEKASVRAKNLIVRWAAGQGLTIGSYMWDRGW